MAARTSASITTTMGTIINMIMGMGTGITTITVTIITIRDL